MARFVDWAAEERKLQSVYEDIQMQQYKPAQAAVERWLKKHPKSQPALVLRMVLLSKLRQGAPAVLKAYEDVKRTGQLTMRSRFFVGMALRGIRRADLVLEMYQNLWAARPDMIELGDQVFLAAAAVGNTEVMTQVSRKLFNATKAPQWARLAAYSAWVHFAPPPTDAEPFPEAPPRTLLPAAILLKATGTEVRSADQLWLRFQIALGNGDAKGAYALVQSDSRKGALARRWAGLRAAKVCAARGVEGVWEDEVNATLTALQVDPEVAHNYAFYAHTLEALENAYSDDLAAKVAKVFDDLIASMGSKERAPALARLELDVAQRKRSKGLPEAEWAEMVNAYLARWGSKWTTVDELPRIAGDDRCKEVTALVSQMKKPHTDERSFCARSVAEMFLLDPQAVGPSDAKPYWDLYQEGLVYGANLPKTDVQPADNMGLTAVNVLLRAWDKTPEDDTPLLTAAACLEYMLTKSPSSFSARFTLVRVYRLLRAPSLYLPHLAKLDLTEIQLDNLLHIVSERGGLEAQVAGPAVAKAWGDVVAKAMTMYSRSATELPEFVKQALEHESYSKIHGMRTLMKCLDSSISQRVLEVEELSLALANGEVPSGAVLESLPAGLSSESPFIDNRNFELLVDSLATTPAPQPTLPESAVRALGAVSVKAAAFIMGRNIPELQIKSDDLNATDKAYVEALDGVLRRTADVDGAESSSSAGVYDDLLAAVSSSKGYSRASALLTLGQLARTLDGVGKRLAELTKPVKGKKRPAGLVALATDLKTAREKVKGTEVVADAVPGAADAAWGVAREWVSEVEVEVLVQKITESRGEFALGLARLLGTK